MLRRWQQTNKAQHRLVQETGPVETELCNKTSRLAHPRIPSGFTQATKGGSNLVIARTGVQRRNKQTATPGKSESHSFLTRIKRAAPRPNNRGCQRETPKRLNAQPYVSHSCRNRNLDLMRMDSRSNGESLVHNRRRWEARATTSRGRKHRHRPAGANTSTA